LAVKPASEQGTSGAGKPQFLVGALVAQRKLTPPSRKRYSTRKYGKEWRSAVASSVNVEDVAMVIARGYVAGCAPEQPDEMVEAVAAGFMQSHAAFRAGCVSAAWRVISRFMTIEGRATLEEEAAARRGREAASAPKRTETGRPETEPSQKAGKPSETGQAPGTVVQFQPRRGVPQAGPEMPQGDFCA
jgi:hypothetical protein